MPAPRRRTADRPPAVTGGEEGMISLVSLFAVLGLLVLFGALANVGRVTARKLEAQNAADAVALAAGVEMARGLNAVTAANHLIGELTALCVLHHALGGDELDNGTGGEGLSGWAARGFLLWSWAQALPAYAVPPQPSTEALTTALSPLTAGAAIRDSRVQLRYALALAYLAHAAGFAALADPFTFAAGVAAMWAARATQEKILLEWKTLDVLEEIARALAPVKKQMMKSAVPALQGYAGSVVALTPARMELAADRVGERNGATAGLFPGLLSHPRLQLPVAQEPARPRDRQKSQLVRAATPWVQYWRGPMFRFGLAWLTLSGFTSHYEKWTNEYTLTLTDRLRRKGVRLYVLRGWEPGGTEKGREEWTGGTDEAGRRADELFGVVGFAHRKPPRVFSYGIYRQTNPDGMVGYAQSMVYGANPQVPWPGGEFQPRLGWDTLHWASHVREFPGESTGWFGLSVPDVDEPRVRINWQTKLVPTTRLVEAWPFQTGPLGTVIRRTSPRHMDLTGTH